MKLYTSIGPNPRLVRLFLAEKGIKVDLAPVDLIGGENRGDEYKRRNPTGQLPCLELDDGTYLSETIAICEYLEDTHPAPPLIGATPEQKAESRMWTRRIELNITEPMANGFRYGEGLPLFKDRIHTIPQAADDLKTIAREGLAWLNRMMDGKRFIVGDRFTLADIVLYSFLEFGSTVGQPIDPALKNVWNWFARVGARPSVETST